MKFFEPFHFEEERNLAMKKHRLLAATALVACAVPGTALAAENPFSDVPKDHWAYDAVETLAADGIIEGYGDRTYRGDRTITRFEMAQMVARAMAKEGSASAENKARIEKLSAEFEAELKNLGLRVEQLEKNADQVIWKGKVRIDYSSPRYEHTPVHGKDYKKNDFSTLFRLEPTGIVNDHWRVRSRINAYLNYDSDSTTTPQLKRLWAEGKLQCEARRRVGRVSRLAQHRPQRRSEADVYDGCRHKGLRGRLPLQHHARHLLPAQGGARQGSHRKRRLQRVFRPCRVPLLRG